MLIQYKAPGTMWAHNKFGLINMNNCKRYNAVLNSCTYKLLKYFFFLDQDHLISKKYIIQIKLVDSKNRNIFIAKYDSKRYLEN